MHPFQLNEEVTIVQVGRSPRTVTITGTTKARVRFDFPEALPVRTRIALERADGSKHQASVARYDRLDGGRIEISAALD